MIFFIPINLTRNRLLLNIKKGLSVNRHGARNFIKDVIDMSYRSLDISGYANLHKQCSIKIRNVQKITPLPFALPPHPTIRHRAKYEHRKRLYQFDGLEAIRIEVE